MDWHKLQNTLYEMDPTDPAEDLRKLKEAAGGSSDAVETVDYVAESVEVAQGSMPIDLDLGSLAALAGVALTEAQKTGSAGQLKAKDAIKKQPAGTTKNPTRDKLVGEAGIVDKIKNSSFGKGFAAGADKDNYNMPRGLSGKAGMDAVKNSKTADKKSKTNKSAPVARAGDWQGFLKQHTAQLQKIAANPKKKSQFDDFMAKIAEDTTRTVEDDSYDSIKEMLYRKLNQSK